MAEYNFPIPGADHKKEIVIFVRRHWAAFLGQFLLSFLLLLIPIIITIIIFVLDFETKIFQGLARNIIVLVLSAYYLVAITFVFISWMSFYYDVYIVTKSEIIEITQEGFFGRKISQLSMLRVQDVTSHIKGFLPTFFGYGNVLVETASEAQENFLLQAVPNPQEVSSKIMELHDKTVEVEGRHHQLLEGEGDLASNSLAQPAKKQGAGFEKEPTKPVPAPPPQKPTPKTPYQELMEKEKQNFSEKPKEEKTENEQGEVTKDDLDKGGEIDFK